MLEICSRSSKLNREPNSACARLIPLPDADISPATPCMSRWLLPGLLLMLYAVQCLWFVETQSLTYDEPVHIAEGFDAWRNGRFEQYNDHPPLARLLCTLPVLGSKWQVEVQQFDQGFFVPRISPDPQALALRTRGVNVVLGVLLGVFVWLACRQLFSEGAANFSLALFAFSPSLISHFSIVGTDGAATLFIFAAAWQVVRWRKNLDWRNGILCGLLFGLLLLAKYSTLPIFGLAVFWILLLQRGEHPFNPLRWNWARAAAVVLIAFFVVWAGYFFHLSHLTVRDGTLQATFPNWHETIVKPVRSPNYSVIVPAGEFIQGFREVMRHNRHGQPAYLLGQVSSSGRWKAYYPVAILLKWPLVVLVLTVFGVALLMMRRVAANSDVWLMLSFPALYFPLALWARFNLGERHVLPLYPFALVATAAVWQNLSRSRAGKLLLLVLLGLNAIDVLRFAPGYLSYFTPFVRPSQTYRLLTDSNLDWGQGLLAVRQYEQQHPNERIRLAYFGSVDPTLYGVTARPLAEQERTTGTVIVGATQLSGQYLHDPAAYRWLLQYPVGEVLDHSMYVFRVPEP